jgi:hypothetical protein
MNALRVPPEDFYQLIFELPKDRFLHTPSFVGMHYTDDLIILDVTFIQGRPKETRLALLKDTKTRVAAVAGVSPQALDASLQSNLNDIGVRSFNPYGAPYTQERAIAAGRRRSSDPMR